MLVVNAIALHQIAEYFNVPAQLEDINAVRSVMDKVGSQETKDALEIADKIADMICFYAHTKSNTPIKLIVY